MLVLYVASYPLKLREPLNTSSQALYRTRHSLNALRQVLNTSAYPLNASVRVLYVRRYPLKLRGPLNTSSQALYRTRHSLNALPQVLNTSPIRSMPVYSALSILVSAQSPAPQNLKKATQTRVAHPSNPITTSSSHQAPYHASTLADPT